MKKLITLSLSSICILLFSCKSSTNFDYIIKNGTVYDGNGGEPMRADIGIRADTIAEIGDLSQQKATEIIDAKGMAVTPGFVNMLSQSQESLIADGRSMSDIKQGVTLEVMGEGESMAPLNDSLKSYAQQMQGDIKYVIKWKTLGEYLDFLEKKGVSTNIASFVGAATVRANVLGFANKSPNAAELEQMKKLVEQAMQDGAMGLSSSLIYAPGTYAKTDELIELSKVAAAHGGIYISHLRSEGNRFEGAVDELIQIAKTAKIHAEIFHLKAAGKQNWYKLDKVLGKIDSANKAGIHVTANMYNYVAGATGLDAAMPPKIQEGGLEAWRKRLQDKALRAKIAQEMSKPQNNWENLCLSAGAEGTLFVGFRQDSLRKYLGKTLAEVAKMRGKTWYETAMDLVVDDDSRVEVVYFLMSEENVKKQIALPYMSFGSDASSQAPEGVFLKSSAHPRAYGNFARLLGKYVRDEKIILLKEAIRKLSSLPCDNLKIKKRGRLIVGNFADIAIFDPTKIQDKATFEKPQQFAEGMNHVFVNGKQVLKNGEHTGVFSGRAVKKTMKN